MLHLSKQASAQDLDTVGLTRLSRQPLIVKCRYCGVEWRPSTTLALKLQKYAWWRCMNGCNHSPSTTSNQASPAHEGSQ
jgi:hypothetical protein